MVDSEKGMPAACAAAAPAASPSVCIIRVNPVGAIANGSAEYRAGGVDVAHVAEYLRSELDVLEGLPGPVQRDLGFRSAVGVVERGGRRSTLRDAT